VWFCVGLDSVWFAIGGFLLCFWLGFYGVMVLVWFWVVGGWGFVFVDCVVVLFICVLFLVWD